MEDLRSFDSPSYSRNPRIMFVFTQMKLAEQRGIGLRNMGKLPEKGYPLPVFEYRSGFLEIRFGRAKRFVVPNKRIDKALSEDDREMLLFIQKNTSVSAPEIAKYHNISDKTAQRRLARLTELGIVQPSGTGRWRKYKVVIKSGDTSRKF